MASSAPPDLISRILRHEKTIVGAGVGLLVVFCWWFLAMDAGTPAGMDGMTMAPPPLAALVVMWWLMMMAMMLPSATPAILLYARVRKIRSGDGVTKTSIFVAGYVIIWLLFSIGAAVAQWLLAGMQFKDTRMAAAVLVAAGLYQLSTVKGACLRQCRSPAQFISRHWRHGAAGALRLGLLHGAYCVGCCWLLMALLFVGGVMNFAWIAALTLLVAIEKLAPRGDLLGKLIGVALIAWGAVLLSAVALPSAFVSP